MTFPDLRSYLDYLEEIGDLLHVPEPVDCKFDISSYTECAYIKGKLRGEPAMFFDQVKGHTLPVVTNLFGTFKRFSSVYGLREDNFSPSWLTAMTSSSSPSWYPPVLARRSCSWRRTRI